MVAGESNFSQKICTIYSSSIHTEEIARSYIYTIMICLYIKINNKGSWKLMIMVVLLWEGT